jgi:hypothetical protein
MSSTATRLFAARNTGFDRWNPVALGAPDLTLQGYKNWLAGIVSGAAPVPASVQFAYDMVRASATLKDNGFTTAEVAGATINGVDATVTFDTTVNKSMLLLANKINGGGNTPNDLITKAVSAIRFLQDAFGYFTHTSDTPGTVSPSVDGTACAFTAVGVDATDAAALADAINAQVTASQKVVAYSDGTSRTYVVADGSNRATVTVSSVGAGKTYGCRIKGIAITPSAGFVTVSGSNDGDAGSITVGGTRVTFTEGASDTLTAVAIAAAINASSTITSKGIYATNAAGVVYIFVRADLAGVAVSATGTGVTVNTATISGASNTDAVDSACLAWAINTNPLVNGIVRAVNASSTTVVVIAKKSAPLKGSGTGVKTAGPLMILSSAAGTITANIAGFDTSVTYATSDAATATALTAAINANTDVTDLGYYALNVASGVVLIQSRKDGDQMFAVGARGTNVTVGGSTTPQTTITIATGSGTIDAYVNGVKVASITATGVDATDAAALAAAINADFYARQFGVATSSAGVVTFTSSLAIGLEAVGAATVSGAYLTNAGLYGGVAGNALTLTTSGNCVRSGATFANGSSGVVVTSTLPGVAGNWILFAAGVADAAHLTASGARLGTSPAGLVNAGAESVATFTFP